MASLERVVRDRKGIDKWSGRHPILSKRSSWVKRHTIRVLRRMYKALDRSHGP